jgi:hypothetical protein
MKMSRQWLSLQRNMVFIDRVGVQGSGLFYIWLSIFREVQQLPRFKEFLREISLVDYWNEFGWPDICRSLDNGDFVCD